MPNQPASYDFVNVASLYRRETKSGKVIFFGKVFNTRVYLFPCEGSGATDSGDATSSGDATQPAFELMVRAEEYDPRGIR